MSQLLKVIDRIQMMFKELGRKQKLILTFHSVCTKVLLSIDANVPFYLAGATC